MALGGRVVAWLVASGMVIGCAGTAKSPPPSWTPRPQPAPDPAAAPKAPTPTPIPFTLPAAPAKVETAPVCLTAGKVGIIRPRLKTYHFDPWVIEPVAYGPRAADRAHHGIKRTLADIRHAMHRRAAYFVACYRWARHRKRRFWRGAYDPELRVTFTVDPFGRVEDVKVKEDRGADRLSRCVRSGLTSLRVAGRTPRRTAVDGTIRFSLSGLPKLGRAPGLRPPPVPLALEAKTCVRGPKVLPTDQLRGEIASYSDYDEIQWLREFSRRHPRSTVPLKIACASVTADIDRQWIVPYLKSNHGALRDCYRRARGRTPGLAGVVKTRFDVDRGGRIHSVNIDGVGDAALHTCMTQALSEIWLPAPTGGLRIELPFRLSASSAGPLPKQLGPRAEALLRRGDGTGAAKAYAELIRRSGGGPDECRGRLGVLRSMMEAAPWLRDARVDAAAKQLVDYATGSDAARADKTCVAEAARSLADVAAWPNRRTRRGYFPRDNADLLGSTARVRALLAAWPTHPLRKELLHFLAFAETRAHDDMRAQNTWVAFLRHGGLTKVEVTHAIKQYNMSRRRAGELPEMRAASCPAPNAFY